MSNDSLLDAMNDFRYLERIGMDDSDENADFFDERNVKLEELEVAGDSTDTLDTEDSSAQSKPINLTMDNCDNDNNSRYESVDLDTSSSIDEPEIDLTEQNNNNYKSNSTQICQEQNNLSVEPPKDISELKVTKTLPYAKPGCSKDSYIVDDELNKETIQICNLLPSLRYASVYKTLHKYVDARNRIELTLWELLPDKQPRIEYLQKRKQVDDACLNECEEMPSKAPHMELDYSSEESDSMSIQCINPQTIFNINNKSTVGIVNGKSLNLENSTQNLLNVDNRNIHNRSVIQRLFRTDPSKKVTVQPAQLVIISNGVQSTHQDPSIKRHTAAPAKLGDIINKQDVNGMDTKMPLNETGQRKKEAVSKVVNAFVGKNACGRNSMVPNVSSNNNTSRKVLSIDNYMRYLEMRAKNKKYKLTCTFESSNFQSLDETEESFARPVTYRTYPSKKNNKIIKQSPGMVKRKCPIPELMDTTELTSKPNQVKIEKADNPKFIPTCVAKDHNGLQNKMAYVQTSIAPSTSLNLPSSKTAVALGTNTPLPQTLSSTTGAIKRTQPFVRVAFDAAATSNGTLSQTALNIAAVLTTSNASLNQVTPTIKGATSSFLEPNLLSNTAPATATSTDPSSISTVAQPTPNTKQMSVSVESTKKEEVELSPEMLQTYYKLLAVVPNVDHTYMKKTCLSFYKSGIYINSTDILEDLINHMLEFGHEHPSVIDVENVVLQEVYDMDKRYEYLSGIFPNADPTYLRKVVKRLYNKPEEMMEYIQSQWKEPNYPTKEQILEQTKITEQQKRYVTKFDVKEFVEVFPDPFTHFEDAKRTCKFNADALEFLKHRFNRIKVATISNMYTQKQHHLTLTAQALDGIESDMKTVRYTPVMLTDNIPVLQECAFITHKAEIKKYLTDLKAMEVAEFEQLKERNELLECQCCYDNECLPSKCSTCDDAHIFCNSCIIRGTETRLADGNTRFPCFLDCDGEFSLSTLQRVLPPTQFSILLHKWQEAEVTAAGVEDLVSCPFCHFATIPPPEDKVFKCLNPECMKESCRNCKELNHVPFKCYELKSDKARLLLEEKMTEALIRKCHRCSRPYFKEDGCNKITCPCGTIMCYICDKAVAGYNHFNERGAGETGCPLWSDNKYINAEVVRQVAQKTAQQIQGQDPKVTVNVNGLLAQLPLGAQRPSERIPDRANTLTRNAN